MATSEVKIVYRGVTAQAVGSHTSNACVYMQRILSILDQTHLLYRIDALTVEEGGKDYADGYVFWKPFHAPASTDPRLEHLNDLFEENIITYRNKP